MTRAKKRLFLTSSKRRFLWGQIRPMQPSRFIKEIPKEYLQKQSISHFTTEEYEAGIPSEEISLQEES